jgi:acyl-CoA thioesterase FadM
MPRVEIAFPEEPVFTTRIEVRITDLNYGNHLAHDSLISILHEARVRFMSYLGMQEWDAEGLAAMVVDLAVSYRSEVHYPQALDVEVAVDDLGTRSCDLLYRVVAVGSERLVALGKTRLVFVDPATHRVGSLPTSFRELVSNQRTGPRDTGR